MIWLIIGFAIGVLIRLTLGGWWLWRRELPDLRGPTLFVNQGLERYRHENAG